MNDLSDIDSMVKGTRDTSLNKTVVNGAGYNTYSSTSLGNLVNVQTSGSGNTVVVNANQINSGSQRSYLVTGGINTNSNQSSAASGSSSNMAAYANSTATR
ncbi:MAG: hypothetical protein ACK5NY_05050 [Burkholderiaceae bacterium]